MITNCRHDGAFVPELDPHTRRGQTTQAEETTFKSQESKPTVNSPGWTGKQLAGRGWTRGWEDPPGTRRAVVQEDHSCYRWIEGGQAGHRDGMETGPGRQWWEQRRGERSQ